MENNRRSIVLYHAFTPFEGDSTETRPIGGSESAMILMMREMATLGWDAEVFCNCQNEGVFSGVKYSHSSKAREALSSRQTDVFISQSNTDIFKGNINSKLNIFWTGGNHDVRSLQTLSDKSIQDRIDHFFFISRWQAENFQKKFGIAQKKSYITRNGYEQSLFKDNIEKIKYRLIYFSSPSRGLDVLLDIFPRIRRRFKEAELHIFSDYEFYGQQKGDGAREHPEVYKKLNQPGVYSFGNVKRDKMAEQVQKAYVMAYPTNFRETSCMAVIEAQAAGTPPVTSRLAALTETVQDGVTGRLVHGNAESFFYKWRYLNTISDLFANEDKWKALSEAGKKRMRDGFTWKKIASEWDQFFREKLR